MKEPTKASTLSWTTSNAMQQDVMGRTPLLQERFKGASDKPVPSQVDLVHRGPRHQRIVNEEKRKQNKQNDTSHACDGQFKSTIGRIVPFSDESGSEVGSTDESGAKKSHELFAQSSFKDAFMSLGGSFRGGVSGSFTERASNQEKLSVSRAGQVLSAVKAQVMSEHCNKDRCLAQLLEICQVFQSEELSLRSQLKKQSSGLRESKDGIKAAERLMHEANDRLVDKYGFMKGIASAHDLTDDLKTLHRDLCNYSKELGDKVWEHYRNSSPFPVGYQLLDGPTQVLALVKQKFKILDELISVLKKRVAKGSEETLTKIMNQYSSVDELLRQTSEMAQKQERLENIEKEFFTTPLLERISEGEDEYTSKLRVMVIALQNELASARAIISRLSYSKNPYIKVDVCMPNTLKPVSRHSDLINIESLIDPNHMTPPPCAPEEEVVETYEDGDAVVEDAEASQMVVLDGERLEKDTAMRSLSLENAVGKEEITRLQNELRMHELVRTDGETLLEDMKATINTLTDTDKKTGKALKLHRTNCELQTHIAHLSKIIKEQDAALLMLNEEHAVATRKNSEFHEDNLKLSHKILKQTQTVKNLKAKVFNLGLQQRALFTVGMSATRGMLSPACIPSLDPSVADSASRIVQRIDPEAKFEGDFGPPKPADAAVFGETQFESALLPGVKCFWRDGVLLYITASRSAILIQSMVRRFLAEKHVAGLRATLEEEREKERLKDREKQRLIADMQRKPSKDNLLKQKRKVAKSVVRSTSFRPDQNVVLNLLSGQSKSNLLDDTSQHQSHRSAPGVLDRSPTKRVNRSEPSKTSTKETIKPRHDSVITLPFVKLLSQIVYYGGDTTDILTLLPQIASQAKAEVIGGLKGEIASVLSRSHEVLNVDRAVVMAELERLSGRPTHHRGTQMVFNCESQACQADMNVAPTASEADAEAPAEETKGAKPKRRGSKENLRG